MSKIFMGEDMYFGVVFPKKENGKQNRCKKDSLPVLR
jgi:hypothetical protein